MTSKNNNSQIESEHKPDGVVTPTTAEQPPQAVVNDERDQKIENQAKRGTKLGTVAIIIAIILGGGSAGYAYKATKDYQAQIQTLQAKLSQTTSQINQQMSELKSNTEAKTADLVNRTQVEITQQQKSVESLQLALAELKGRRPNDWLLAESDYLVKLSGRKLFLEHDVVSATYLMESADQRIASLNDPSLVPLRKAMANDITTLKAVPLIDKDGLVLRLSSLQQKIDALPLANAILPDAPKAQEREVDSHINNWRQNLLTSLKKFSENFITFRTRDGNAIPLLSPNQHFYLRENLKMKLATAIKAVYDEQQEIYSTSLQTALKWSNDYLSSEDNTVKQFNKAIAQLAQQKVQVFYPVKLESQRLLTDVINERLRREVTSVIKEEK
jgi:uroporphyrin-III C-methyltransferase